MTTIETPVLTFTPELAERVVGELILASDISAIRSEEVDSLTATDYEAYQVFGDVLARWLPRGEDGADAATRGFLVGRRIVRLAAGEATLPPRQVNAATGYYAFVQKYPDRLDRDFTRDYAAHPVITALVDKTIPNPITSAHAKLAFNLYGKEANPNRPLEPIPSARTKGRQFVGAASAGVLKRRRR